MFVRGLIVLTVALTTGCYTYEPIRGPTPETGVEIELDINDAGRFALGGVMGPEIAQIEGRLIENGNEDYLVKVLAVHLLRGGEQAWTGEAVRIKAAYVSSIYQKKFSAGRTAVLGAVGVGIVAAIAGQSLIGGGQTDPATSPRDTSHTTRRRP